MSDPITPHAKPIQPTGEAEWFPPEQDDSVLTPRPEPSTLHKVFFGRDGMRAGWAFLLWFVFTSIMARGVNIVAHMATRGYAPSPVISERFQLITGVLGFIVVAGAALVVSRMERRTFSDYGLGTIRGRGKDIGTGLFWGFAMLSLLVGILRAGGFITFSGLNLHTPGPILFWALIFAASFFFVGLFEEFAFRGFPQFTLTRGIAGVLRNIGMDDHAKPIAFWIVATLLAILFGAVHAGNAGETLPGLIAAGAIGFVFAFSLWRTGSLWWAVGFHAAWNWAESFFYGTADSGGVSLHRLLISAPQGNPTYSGGTVGPEGSLFVFLVILATMAVIALTLKPRPGSPSSNETKGLRN